MKLVVRIVLFHMTDHICVPHQCQIVPHPKNLVHNHGHNRSEETLAIAVLAIQIVASHEIEIPLSGHLTHLKNHRKRWNAASLGR
jgi:hypothetical protein